MEACTAQAGQLCFIINLGPTTTLPVDGQTNMISVINKTGEFVFAGNDVARIIETAELTARTFVPDRGAGGEASRHGFHVVIDVLGTIRKGRDGWEFDPLGTHFGHFLKHYSNGLRKIGFGSVVKRARDYEGSFVMGDLIRNAREQGALRA